MTIDSQDPAGFAIAARNTVEISPLHAPLRRLVEQGMEPVNTIGWLNKKVEEVTSVTSFAFGSAVDIAQERDQLNAAVNALLGAKTIDEKIAARITAGEIVTRYLEPEIEIIRKAEKRLARKNFDAEMQEKFTQSMARAEEMGRLQLLELDPYAGSELLQRLNILKLVQFNFLYPHEDTRAYAYNSAGASNGVVELGPETPVLEQSWLDAPVWGTPAPATQFFAGTPATISGLELKTIDGESVDAKKDDAPQEQWPDLGLDDDPEHQRALRELDTIAQFTPQYPGFGAHAEETRPDPRRAYRRQ